MTYQAYLDNIKAKTGKTPDDFRKLAAKKGLTKYPELMVWLKSRDGGHMPSTAVLNCSSRPIHQASPART